nr:hypothetical protein [Tanacetum cinerariifolium]
FSVFAWLSHALVCSPELKVGKSNSVGETLLSDRR